MSDALAAAMAHVPAFEPGHVWLAGAGPGDPGCLTLAVLAGLRRAVADRLSVVTSAAAPTVTDIPDGEFRIWKNTTAGTVRLYANDSGTLRSVQLT